MGYSRMRNPYDVLGVAKTASAADIKSAFRRLAKKFHPDQSKEPKAKERFAEANQAYEILGDDKKRPAFDRGEIDAEGKPRAPDFSGFGGRGPRPGGPAGAEHFEFNFGGGQSPFSRGGPAGMDTADILSELFGAGAGGRGRAPARGEDVAVTARLSLETAIAGGQVRIALPSGRTLDVSAPPGTEDGRQMRLRGQGGAGAPGGERGDAIVTFRIEPHRHFRVDGRDLRLDLPLTLYEAALGAKVAVPTLNGTVELSIPAHSSSGRTLRLRGKGLPASGGAPAGDLLVSLQLVLPPEPGKEFEELMRRWQDSQSYDPRKGMT